MATETIQQLVKFQLQLRMLHWGTNSYARHMAYGNTYEELDDLIDTFVESCFGKHGRAELTMSIDLHDIKQLDLNTFLQEFISFLTNDISSQYEQDTDLLNIRDEILGLINKLKYLLTLK